MAISNKFFTLIAVAILATAAAGQHSTEAQPQLSVVSANASCLVQKLKGIGSAPPQFDKGKYKIKGILLPHSGPEGDSEVFLLFYGENDRSATLYSTFLREEQKGLRIYIGQWSTFKSENGRLAPDELPGGLATHKQILDVFRRVQKGVPLFLRTEDVQDAKPMCVWQP